jgi:hypothetical protein
MKKLFILLLVVFIVGSFGLAFANKPDNGNTKHPQNPPCDSDHGHPLANFLRQGKDRCQADADDANDTDDADDNDDHGDGRDDDAVDDDNGDGNDQDADADQDADVDGDLDTDGENLCTAAAGDPGLLTTDTMGQTLWDGGISALNPLTEDPERNGVISGPLGDAFTGTPLEVVGDELACLIDLLLDENVSPIDL